MVRKIKFGGVDWRVDLNGEAIAEMSAILSRGSKIAVACSGGADSVFALYCVADVFSDKLDDLYVLHFNHKARVAADNDEVYVKNLCERLKLNFVRGEPESRLSNISENSFREARMKFLSEKFKELGLAAIVQGHHLGDVLESSLMSLARGAGGEGLSSPRPVSHFQNMTFVRPILDIPKSKIVEFLMSSKIPWREDESNAELDFFRNRIRNVVIPVFAQSSTFDVFAGAARSKKLLREDSDFIAEIFEREFEKQNGDWRMPETLNLGEVLSSSRALARRAILRYVGKNNLKLRSGAVDSLVEKVVSVEKVSVSAGVNGDKKIFIDYNNQHQTLSLRVVDCENEKLDYALPLKLGKNVLPNGSSISVAKVSLTKTRKEAIKSGDNNDNVTAFIELDCVGTLENGALIARSKLAGDAYAPLGLNTPKKVKDIFNAKKTPSMKRNSLPRVCNKKGEILWIPTLPPSNKYKITNSGTAIELTFSEREY